MASILPEWRTKAKPENVQLLFDAAPVKGKVALHGSSGNVSARRTAISSVVCMSQHLSGRVRASGLAAGCGDLR